MKPLIVLLILCLAVNFSCKKGTVCTGERGIVSNSDCQKCEMTLSGTLKEQGPTTYMYGTHVLKVKDTFYALKSDNVKLNDYVGKTVTINGNKISGYPVDGGPDYVNVICIK